MVWVKDVVVLCRAGDTEWHESEAGSFGQRTRETACQEGAVKRATAVSGFHSFKLYFLLKRALLFNRYIKLSP